MPSKNLSLNHVHVKCTVHQSYLIRGEILYIIDFNRCALVLKFILKSNMLLHYLAPASRLLIWGTLPCSYLASLKRHKSESEPNCFLLTHQRAAATDACITANSLLRNRTHLIFDSSKFCATINFELVQ